MNADLEAAIEEGRRRMRQFEERTANHIDSFDKEVDNRHHRLGHKFSSITEDLKPVSAPLWGVILETSTGQRIYKQDAPFDVVSKCPRRCRCTSHIGVSSPVQSSSSASQYANDQETLYYEDYWNMHKEIEPFKPSIEAQTIMMGRKFGVDKYLHDEQYVSNPPYGIIMKKPVKTNEEDSKTKEPDTSKVSAYWRRKYKIS